MRIPYARATSMQLEIFHRHDVLRAPRLQPICLNEICVTGFRTYLRLRALQAQCTEVGNNSRRVAAVTRKRATRRAFLRMTSASIIRADDGTEVAEGNNGTTAQLSEGATNGNPTLGTSR